MQKFQSLYFRAFFEPAKSIDALLHSPRYLKYGLYAVTIQAILYTFVYVFLIYGGGRPFKPWLDIPEDVYYRYNVFFCAPSMYLGWILAAGTIHSISRIFTGNGRFEQTLAILGFGIGIASWSTGLHDLLTSFLGAIHVISQSDYEVALNSPTIWRTILWVLMAAYLVWFILLFTKGLKIVYKINGLQAFLFGLLAFVVYQGFFLVFNR